MEEDCWEGRVNSAIVDTTKHPCAVKSSLNVYPCVAFNLERLRRGPNWHTVPSFIPFMFFFFFFKQGGECQLSFCVSLSEELESWALISVLDILFSLSKPGYSRWAGLGMPLPKTSSPFPGTRALVCWVLPSQPVS